MPPRHLALLGPQKPRPVLADVLRRLGIGGRCAAITSGWQERELEVERLDAHLGRETRNLRLYHRSDELFLAHPELREALWTRKRQLDAVQALYRLRLGGMLDSCRELLRRTDGEAGMIVPQRAEAIEQVRVCDRQHLERLTGIRADFEAAQDYASHPAIAAQRAELRALVDDCDALLIAGGHVLVLLNRLALFGIADLVAETGIPVIAWSAGAMALTPWIVLFHHSPPQGANDTVIAAPGLGLAPDVVAFPHASRRLTLDQPPRVALLARRFAPSVCAALDPEGWIEHTPDGWRGHGTARRLCVGGQLEPLA